MFKLGYNTNGFTSHSLSAAIDIIGSLGYRSIAITIDHHALNPFGPDLKNRLVETKLMVNRHNLSSVIETGARFLLNPWCKHEPTMISPEKKEREYRINFLETCIDIAAELGSDCVSIWSGQKTAGIDRLRAWDWLASGCCRICRKAETSGLCVGFEPEPGMFIENMAEYEQLKKEVNHNAFKLTLDLGHALITEDSPVATIQLYKDEIVNIHLEDMKKNKHDHLFPGEGQMAFDKIFHELRKIGYQGQVNLELSRHSHNAVETARRAFAFFESEYRMSM